MRHDCGWPGCKRRIPIELFACRHHWPRIPLELRTQLRALVPAPGTLPSLAYMEAARAARAWALEQNAKEGAAA
jgi:hypothetical protein